jgi:hypothetical protein
VDIDIQGFDHPRARATSPLAIPVPFTSGPDRVAAVPELGFVFWLQPEEFTNYGSHGDPGDLIVAPMADDGTFELEGMCDAWKEVDETYYDNTPDPDAVAEIERLLREES